jgi:hypothetical protein
MSGGATVRQTATGTWAVMDGDSVLAEFETNAQAWRWVDRHERAASLGPPRNGRKVQRRLLHHAGDGQ